MKTIVVGQIGVGYWGPNLLRNLMGNRSCRVKTVADTSEERRRFVESLYPGVSTVDSADAVLGDPGIDAIVISTPAQTHYPFAMQALAAGKHILVEKPMATSVREVEEIAASAKANNLVAMVGHTFLFNSSVRYLKSLIDSGELGDLRYIYSQRLNLGRIRSDVDALWNLAPHDISIIQYLMGNQSPERVTRTGMDFVQESIDDVVFLSIRYPGKVMAHVHVSWLDPHKVRTVTVVGSRKMVVYDDMADNKIAIYDKGIDLEAPARLGEHMDYDKGIPPSYIHRSGDVLMPSIRWVEPLGAEIAHFLACVAGVEQCITGPDHAREVVRILSASQNR